MKTKTKRRRRRRRRRRMGISSAARPSNILGVLRKR